MLINAVHITIMSLIILLHTALGLPDLSELMRDDIDGCMILLLTNSYSG